MVFMCKYSRKLFQVKSSKCFLETLLESNIEKSRKFIKATSESQWSIGNRPPATICIAFVILVTSKPVKLASSSIQVPFLATTNNGHHSTISLELLSGNQISQTTITNQLLSVTNHKPLIITNTHSKQLPI